MKEKLKNYIKKITTSIKKFVTTNSKMKLLVAYLAVNLIYLLLGSYIYTTRKLAPNFTYEQFAIGIRYLLGTNTIVFVAIYILKRYKKNVVVHTCAVFIAFFGVIATMLAVDIGISLNGCFARYEGIFSILYYLTLMILSTFVSNKYKKFLVNSILICGVIQACYAICQIYQLFNVKVVWHTYKQWNETANKVVEIRRIWATAFTSNRNFFGTYMLICLSYSLGMFIDSKKIIQNIIYSILIVLFMFGVLISNTTSVIIGLGAVLLYMLIYSIKNKKFLKLFVITFLLIDIGFIAVKLDKTNLIRDIKITGNETTQIAKGNSEASYGTNRLYIWKNTMKIVPKYIWHGAGVDNFAKAFDGDSLKMKVIYNKKRNRVDHIMAFDKAHNEYLQTLVTQGIFSLITYLILYGYIVIHGIRNSFKHKEAYLILPVIGYLVQAFFNISVIEVAPIFFIALGLCTEVSKKENSIKGTVLNIENSFENVKKKSKDVEEGQKT